MAVAKRESRVDEVAAELVSLVRKVAAADGRELPATNELAERFGVSRPVIREAISRLEVQGLIEVKHGVGLQVCNELHRPIAASVSLLVPDKKERLRQTMAARLVVETEIARLAARRVGDDQLRRFEALQGRLAHAVTTEEAVEADIQFHRLLAECCGNEVLALMLESIMEFGYESRKKTIARAGAEQAHQTHQMVVEALRRHDPDKAAEAMRNHLQTAWGNLEESDL